MKNGIGPGWIGVFSLLALAACGATPDDQDEPSTGEGSPEELSEDVGEASQALGGWSELASSTRPRPMSVGPTYTLFLGWTTTSGEGCRVPLVFDTTTGAQLPVPAFPRCGRAFVATSASNGLFVHHSPNLSDSGTIYSLIQTNGTFSWSPIAFTSEQASGMVADSQYVFWAEGWTVYRVGRLGSPVLTVATDRTLVGVSGSDLYLIDQVGDGYDLMRRSRSGSSESTVRADIDPTAVSESSFDASYLYFAESSGGTNRLQRIARSGGALSTVKSSTSVRYVSPFSTGSALYWREERLSDGAATIRRKNLLNGNHVTTSFPMAELDQMLVASSGIYAIGRVDAGVDRWALIRGGL